MVDETESQESHLILYLFIINRVFPSLLREGSYSTIRLGAYEPLKKCFGATDPAHTPLWKKICSGAISGAFLLCIIFSVDLFRFCLPFAA